jgi:hypothetical protein
VCNGKEPWTLSKELAGRREPTQVARALEELGINLILARTPQAKGRVERCWGTLQDRLVKELRRANARTVAEANQALRRYLQFNKRFARPPADARPAFRRLPRGTDLDLAPKPHQQPLPAPKPAKTVPTNDHAASRKPPPDHPWRRSPRYPVTNSQAS